MSMKITTIKNGELSQKPHPIIVNYLKNQNRRPQNALYASRRDCVHVLYLPRHDRQFNLHVYDVACLQLHWKFF
jgi:hypothetical protein